ncbi:MAG: polysaccharide deacetylase family protein [Armatimonadota bacterium]|nr:MAG: polysaccharide deacetylase family protein [Armatimonadota bacterium]
MTSEDRNAVQIEMPEGIRCAIALTYDTDMAGGYAPDLICHGCTMPALQDYMFRLCNTAEQHGVRLHFFQIGNGLVESEDVTYLREILRRGHVVDSHTYSHIALVTPDIKTLDEELALTNQLFEKRLGWKSTVLRGPGGYQDGLRGKPENQRVIIRNGFHWVSCQYDNTLAQQPVEKAVEAAGRDLPYAYDTGLVEFPLQGFTDRVWFETVKMEDRELYDAWRAEWGHKAVPDGSRAPWTTADALDNWIDYNLAAADYAYDNGLLWIICWHPYSHYVHDPENKMLPALLQHCAAKSKKKKADMAWVCTLRDAVALVAT